MKSILHSFTRTLTLLYILAFINQAWATDGYFSHGYGTKQKSMGGVSTALTFNAFSAITNPANAVYIQNNWGLGIAFFNPNRQYAVSGSPSGFPNTFPLTPGTVKSKSTGFFIPSLSYNRLINEKSAFNFAIFGNGGMNTDYKTNTFNTTKPTGVNLSQLFVNTSYAYKVIDNHAFGVTAIFGYQWFEAKGLTAFSGFSRYNTKLTDNKSDKAYGYGARLGYSGQITPQLRIGASYQTRIWMTEFNDYKGLFAEKGDFDVPATWNAGLAWDINSAWTLAADLTQIYYSSVKSVGNPMKPADFQNDILLGDKKGAGFGWNDMTVYKIGCEYRHGNDWSARVGYNYGKQPIPTSEVMFNILAPGVIEHHLTFGASKKIGSKYEISLAVMRGFSNEVKGANPMEAPGQQAIALKMNQWEFEIGLGF